MADLGIDYLSDCFTIYILYNFLYSGQTIFNVAIQGGLSLPLSIFVEI